jgi:hypothetical protein
MEPTAVQLVLIPNWAAEAMVHALIQKPVGEEGEEEASKMVHALIQMLIEAAEAEAAVLIQSWVAEEGVAAVMKSKLWKKMETGGWMPAGFA